MTLAEAKKHAGGLSSLDLSSLESHHPSGAKVHLDDSGVLHWPVLFMYPEHAESDFVADFNENAT